jgi:hypothetical protein
MRADSRKVHLLTVKPPPHAAAIMDRPASGRGE